MPLMMDDLDDLFGDTAPLPLPQSAPAHGLPWRLDELRLSGCCQKLAWSKTGCLAYVNHDGSQVYLASLRCNTSTGMWELSQGMPVKQIPMIYGGREVVHISWNPSGLDLVVADIFGRITIFSMFIAINRVTVSKAFVVDPEDHLNAIVGFQWLNTDRAIQVYRSASKQGDQWNLSYTQHKSLGPYNLSGKTASTFIVVTRNSSMKIVFQGPDGQWHDAKHEIEGFSTSNDLLTHAAVCHDRDNTLLLVTHTTSKQMRLFRIAIDWKPVTEKQQVAPMQPNCEVRHLKTIDDCSPIRDNEENNHGNSSMYMTPASHAELSHLELLPPNPPQAGPGTAADSTNPTIVAVFSHFPTQYNDNELREDGFSIVSRWEISSGEWTIHPIFDQLTAKRSSASSSQPKAGVAIKRLEDFRDHRIVLALQQLGNLSTIAIGYSDGYVEYRDRGTFETLQVSEESDKVSSLSQMGFDYLDNEPCLHISLSTNACVKASLSTSHAARIGVLQLPREQITEYTDRSLIEKATMAILLATMMSCAHSNTSEDLAKVLQVFTDQVSSSEFSGADSNVKTIRTLYLTELYRSLGINLDRSLDPQPEKLLRHPMVQRCFSMQASLGFQNDDRPRTLPSKVAWTLLNVRLISMTFALAFQKFGSGTEIEINKPEVLQSMLGLVSWSISLMNYIVDELFELSFAMREYSSKFDMEHLRYKVKSTNTPALSLVLVSSSRTFLKYNCRGLRGLFNNTRASPHPIAREIDQVFTSSPITAAQFERILAEVDSGVKKAYQPGDAGSSTTNNSGSKTGAGSNGTVTDSQRQVIEKDMLISASLPDVLAPVIERLLTSSMTTLEGEIDRGELFFKDVSCLGLSDDERTKCWSREHVLDAIRKVELDVRPRSRPSHEGGRAKIKSKSGGTGDIKTRTCTRCGAVMEDLIAIKGANPWMSNLQRTCFCGGFWMLEPEPEAEGEDEGEVRKETT